MLISTSDLTKKKKRPKKHCFWKRFQFDLGNYAIRLTICNCNCCKLKSTTVGYTPIDEQLKIETLLKRKKKKKLVPFAASEKKCFFP